MESWKLGVSGGSQGTKGEVTIIRVTPSATQKMTGPVRSVSFIMLPSAGLQGFSTVRAFCQMWSRLMPSSGQRAEPQGQEMNILNTHRVTTLVLPVDSFISSSRESER